MRVRLVRLAVLWAALVAFAAPLSAQTYTGRIDVIVADATGAILPGVSLELTGPQKASAVTDEKGEAHFLNLAPGTYTVTAKLTGFGDYINSKVPVAGGAGSPLKIAMAVGSVTQTIDVSAESPLIDPRKTTTTTNVSYEELQQIPSARDPWVVLQTVPGVVVDRVNVGGAESGQQSNYQAKGAASGENTWNIDGIAITDMSALGSTPTYYDFDMFQEMNVTTGGADMANATPGVALNFVLKAGTNTPHGSTRIYYENEDMQSTNLPDDLQSSLGGATGKGSRIKEYQDYGFELGGPIWKDKVWAWGAYGKTDVTLLTLQNNPDQTILDNRSFKTTAQISRALRAGFTYFRGDKLKYGRSAGATRPPATTWNQSGPTALYKGEANVAIGSNLFVTGRYAYVDGGFALTPQGGLDEQWYVDDDGTNRGTFYHYETVRPQKNLSADANFFRGRHEVKFGFGYKKADVDSTTIMPGNKVQTIHDGYPNMIANLLVWDDHTSVSGKYANFYVGDTISWDRLTMNVGIRWDRQSSSVNPGQQPGHPLAPTLLPAVTGTAFEDAVEWSSWTPRIGITYAMTESRKTLARASYGSFASQLNATTGGFMSTVGYRGLYFYNVVDTNGNRFVDASEIAGRTCSNASPASECNWSGFDIDNPGQVGTPIHTIGDYDTPITHEFQLGLDHELFPNFGLSGTFTYRGFTNFIWRNNGLVGTDYVLSTPLTGSDPAIGNYETPIYVATRVPENRSATEYRARDGYSQRYIGFELAATKRLSDRWMARFGFSTNDHREYFDDLGAMGDPTPNSTVNLLTGTGPNQDGGVVMRQSTGSGKSGIYQVLPKYQFILTGLYQAKWGINLAANMVNRQGFSTPYFRNLVPTSDPVTANKTVLLIDEVDDERLPAMTNVDLRVGKEFTIKRTHINLDVDIFNAFNSSTVLGRQYNLRLGTGDDVLEIMNPRVLRLGLRFNF